MFSGIFPNHKLISDCYLPNEKWEKKKDKDIYQVYCKYSMHLLLLLESWDLVVSLTFIAEG